MSMSLFNSSNPKVKQHRGILGAFSVDVIKWEPENDKENRNLNYIEVFYL